MSLLRVEGLFCQYGSRPIVDDVSFAVERGEIFALLGPNGAGKSTTFRILAGLESKYRGQILFAEQELVGPLWKRARLGLGYLPQKSVALWKLTVAENVLIPLRQRGETNPQPLLSQVGLSKHLQRRACELSGGEIRRLELARCLALQPRLMILDEPFAALDPLAVEQFSVILQELRDQGITIVFSDHAVGAALQLCDRAIIMDQGRILAKGTSDEIVKNPLVKQRYLGNHFTF